SKPMLDRNRGAKSRFVLIAISSFEQHGLQEGAKKAWRLLGSCRPLLAAGQHESKNPFLRLQEDRKIFTWRVASRAVTCR
ncbi:hypothetical protein NKH57_23750, partial [Mesorhizobium sp. M1050]|uniref:hypothetical protein n=1 Tax=Mesorhizobium sp. M1050 TaxID=2957051 RepID=UPI0033361D17